MLNLYITVGTFALLTAYLFHKKFNIMGYISLFLTLAMSFFTYQIYNNAKEVSNQPISVRREEILSTAILEAAMSKSNQDFVKLVDEAAKDNVITNAEYDALRPYIPNEIVIRINKKYPDALNEERKLSNSLLVKDYSDTQK